MEHVPITFLPHGLSIPARPGDTILDAALDHAIEIPHICGGNCACTSCHVYVDAAPDCLSAIEPAEEDRLQTAESRLSASRLACQALLQRGPIVVTVVTSPPSLVTTQ